MEISISVLFNMIMFVIAVEAATNLITKSEFSIRFIKEPLFKLRRFRFFNFVHTIVDCGYCTSVWSACVFALLFVTNTFQIVVLVLVLHRLSNILHFAIDWLDEKRSRDLYFNNKGEENGWIREEHESSLVTRDEENSGAGSKNSA